MTEKNYASPFLRLLATLIDQLLGLGLLMFVSMPVFGTNLTEILDGVVLVVIFLIYTGVFMPLFYAYLISKFGGTPGKLLTGIQIETEAGNPISFKRAFFRTYVGYTVSYLFMGLGYFWAFKDEKRRGWHDLTSGTVVIQTNASLRTFGIFVFAGLLLLNLMLTKNITLKVSQNKDFYTEIIEDVNSEMKVIYPDKETTPTPPINSPKNGVEISTN